MKRAIGWVEATLAHGPVYRAPFANLRDAYRDSRAAMYGGWLRAEVTFYGARHRAGTHDDPITKKKAGYIWTFAGWSNAHVTVLVAKEIPMRIAKRPWVETPKDLRL